MTEIKNDQAETQSDGAAPKSTGFWKDAWIRFRRRKLAMTALSFVCLLSLVAIFSPAIAGTKPVVCKYKGRLYFPALGYFIDSWENPIFMRDGFGRIYPKNLKEKDPDSWAIWPLIYQDPHRRVRAGEWEDRPGNPSGAAGKPYLYYLYLTGVDRVFGTEWAKASFEQPPRNLQLVGNHRTRA